MTKETIEKSIVINAPQATVFKALTSENDLTHWFPDQVKLEARNGGAVEFRFLRVGEAVENRVVGKVLEIVPNRKFSMSWKKTSDPNFPDTTVTWTLEPAGNDGSKTKVTLVHSGFERGSQWFDLHDGGWSYFIPKLEEYCTTGRVENRDEYKKRSSCETRRMEPS